MGTLIWHDELFPDRVPYHIEKRAALSCRADQWTGFSMTGTSVMKD